MPTVSVSKLLTGSDSREVRWVLAETDPGRLEAKYREWTETKKLAVVHRLIQLPPLIESQIGVTSAYLVAQMQNFLAEVSAPLLVPDQPSEGPPE